MERHRESFEPYIRKRAEVAILADGASTQKIELLIAPVLFKDSQGRAFEATVQLYIMSLGFDLAIGLPDIRMRFAALLMDMLLNGHSHLNLVDGKWISGPRKKSSKRRRAHML